MMDARAHHAMTAVGRLLFVAGASRTVTLRGCIRTVALEAVLLSGE